MNHDNNTSLTQQQSLVIDIDAQRLSYMIYHPRGNEHATVGQILINASNQDEWCKELENAVYDNPFLLEEFNSCIIALHAQHFALMPQEVAEAGLAKRVLEESFSSVDGEVFTSSIKGLDAVIENYLSNITLEDIITGNRKKMLGDYCNRCDTE